MELKELKCPNCKARLTVDKDLNDVKCDYCDAKFHVDKIQEKNQVLKEKLVEETAINLIKGVSKVNIIFITIVVIFVGFFSFKLVSGIIGYEKEYNKGYKASYFNQGLEFYAGREDYVSVESLLTDVITKNKKNERKITVSYNEIETSNIDEITKIKNNLNRKSDYDISFDYDDKMYINKVTITEMYD